MEPNCASYNFEIPTSQAGVHKCELNNSTHESNEDDLVNDQNFVYRGTKVSLGQGFGGGWVGGGEGAGYSQVFRRTCSQATASCLHETVFKNWPQFLKLFVK